MVVVSFVVVFVSFANVISGLLLTASKKALTFIMTSREAFYRAQEWDYKGFLKGQHSPTNVFFGD